jgi:uridine kinase
MSLPQRPTVVGIAGCSGSGKTTLARELATQLEAAPFLVVEGILALHYTELWPLYDFSIYVDAPNEICLNRRIYRDMRERGRTEESVRAQFEATARPMAEEYVLPSQVRASITVSGTEALDWSIERVLRGLRDRGLLR